jgi:hypothetical protein
MQAFLGDLYFGCLQFPGDPVAIRRSFVHALLETADLSANFLELPLLDLREIGVLCKGAGHESGKAGGTDQADGDLAWHRAAV